MWFSSGGTKSVVHTDSVENINCLVRGQKEFVLVDPHQYGDMVTMIVHKLSSPQKNIIFYQYVNLRLKLRTPVLAVCKT